MINNLYIHVPFCKSICYYCDFCHRIYDTKTVNKWLEVLEKEIKEKCDHQYQTIYIGGGTPNSLTNEELDKLLSLIEPYSKKVKEYTIEINPESFTKDQISLFKKYGINRFSIGIQSSNNKLLKEINRKHSFEDAINTVSILKENGFNNISVDIMFSLPNQTMDDLDKTIDDIIALDIPHISAYSLTIHENTVFGKKGTNHLDEEIETDMYFHIIERLKLSGYIQYEVSNFCKEGYESEHNLAFWHYDDYLGLSLGAASKIGNVRYTNTKNINEYFKDFNKKEEYYDLETKDLIIENVMLSLRTNRGININEFNKRYNMDFYEVFDHSLYKFQDAFAAREDSIICKDIPILNHILTYFYMDLDVYNRKNNIVKK